MARNNAVVAVGNGHESPLLVVTPVRRVLNERRPVVQRRSGNVEPFAAVSRANAVMSVSGGFDAPLLVVSLVTVPLDDGG